MSTGPRLCCAAQVWLAQEQFWEEGEREGGRNWQGWVSGRCASLGRGVGLCPQAAQPRCEPHSFLGSAPAMHSTTQSTAGLTVPAQLKKSVKSADSGPMDVRILLLRAGASKRPSETVASGNRLTGRGTYLFPSTCLYGSSSHPLDCNRTSWTEQKRKHGEASLSMMVDSGGIFRD